MVMEGVEICSFCGEVNPYRKNDDDSFIITCAHCGKKIFLCDACLNSEDNEGQMCDWRPKSSNSESLVGSECFRGKIQGNS